MCNMNVYCVCIVLAMAAVAFGSTRQDAPQYPFQDWNLPVDDRVSNLVSLMTLEEKINQTWTISPAIPRLGINAYNWRSNCLHGWAASGGQWMGDEKWTVFPTPTGLAASFNPDLIRAIGDVTSTEGRALHNLAISRLSGASPEARGINCYSPNVNLIRDARWGRNMETFGEDPTLTSALGEAYIRGLQGPDDSKYTKVAACSKHYAVHDGPEALRETFVANVTLQDMFGFYLVPFENTVTFVQQVMCAYSGVNEGDGAPDCANSYLLNDVLRGRFGFEGSVVSDNGAVQMVKTTHKYVSTYTEAAALCINAGCDSDLGHDAIFADYLGDAISKGMVDVSTLDQAVARLMKLRFDVGEFDPDWLVGLWTKYGVDELNTTLAYETNLESARESLVLLRNEKGTLPLSSTAGLKVALVGPLGDDIYAQLANYQGISAVNVTILDALQSLKAAGKIADVTYDPGCKNADVICEEATDTYASAVAGADVVLFAMGIDGSIEGEGLDRSAGFPCKTETFTSDILGLPGCQSLIVRNASRSVSTSVPKILLLLHGGAVTFDPATFDAVLDVAYPGGAGGLAVADVLFGNYNPGGKLPYTVPASAADMPSVTDYSLTDRTYQFMTSKQLYPFGYGLSYTSFVHTVVSAPSAHGKLHDNTKKPATAEANIGICDSFTFSSSVQNTGNVSGAEVVQVYVRAPKTQANWTLRKFQRVELVPGEKVTLEFTLTPEDRAVVNEAGERWVYGGDVLVWVGGGQPNLAAATSGPVRVLPPVRVSGTQALPLSACRQA